MRIGVDVDGVLADFNSAFIELIARKTGKELPPVGPDYPDTWNYHRPTVTSEEEKKVWDVIKKSREFWEHLDPLVDHIATPWVLGDLQSEGHEVYFLTARHGANAQAQTAAWLRRRGLDHPAVIIVSGTNEEHQAKLKGLLASALRLDGFVDDKPENCEAVKHFSPQTVVYLLDRPWNRTFSHPDIKRVKRVEGMLMELGLVERGALDLAA